MTFAQPRPIEERDVLTPFDCGVEDLNRWLVQRSLRAHRRGSARTYVVLGDDGLLAGYLALAATDVGRERGPFHRDMPDPVPAVLLARLAVATGAQGRGLGRALVEHAWRTCQAVSEQSGSAASWSTQPTRTPHGSTAAATSSPSPPASPPSRES